jgi:hypothetical protein
VLAIAAAAFTARTKIGGVFPPVFRAHAERVKEEAESRLGAEAPRIWAEAARLGRDEAIALAFGTASPRRHKPTPTVRAARTAPSHGKQRFLRDTAWAVPQEILEDFIRCGYARFNQAERETVDEQEPAHAQTAPL